MQSLFLADLHLGENTPDILHSFQQLITYCEKNVEEIESIYILGDFFELWIGDDYQSDAVSYIFSQLHWLSEQNIKTFFMHGNRDFLIGKQFEQLTGFKLISDPHLIALDNHPTLLSHGDILCTDDKAYQQLRNMFRDPAWQQDFLGKTLEQRYQMALEARKQSQANHQEKTQKQGQDGEYIEDVNQQAVSALMSENQAYTLIHGHTHRPNTHTFSLNDKTAQRIVLAAWYKKGSFLKYENERFETVYL